ncbi:MAG: hypothetical protein BWK78_09195 [Thiotrichaceae bacterium IS1]|nr:MAG: hypothetical protein BWK78_09195 [Thiotrichaceae bacterium IS1]
MGLKDLETFLVKQTHQTKIPREVNWVKVKTEWLEQINGLYSQVIGWLSQLNHANQIQHEFRKLILNEEHLGDYPTQMLVLKLANQEVILEPVGRIIIGATGRVDLRGRAGEVKLLLVEPTAKSIPIKMTLSASKQRQPSPVKDQKLVWKIGGPPPVFRLTDLDENSFADALLEVMNG